MNETWWLIAVVISSVVIGAFAIYDSYVSWGKQAPVAYIALDFLVAAVAAAALTYATISLVVGHG